MVLRSGGCGSKRLYSGDGARSHLTLEARQRADFNPAFLKPQATHTFGASSWKLSATQIFGANHSLTHVLKQTWIYFGAEYKIGMTLTIK